MLASFLTRKPDAYCFSPRECGVPAGRPGLRYSVISYHGAVSNTCKKLGIAHWFPYQLRHAVATRMELADASAYERATCVLGHYDPSLAKIYAHGKLQRAAKIAATFG